MLIKTKICGLTRLQDACVAVEAGADLLGFIFYPKSKRCADMEVARRIVGALPPEVETVGVFVNESVSTVREAVARCGLRRVQLHGTESVEMVAALADLRPIKALPLKAESADLLQAYADAGAEILVDTPCVGWGGSGETGDWELAADWASRVPLMLSGGLRADNVAEAIARVKPIGVDVASGVEESPGIKDPDAIRAFLQATRS